MKKFKIYLLLSSFLIIKQASAVDPYDLINLKRNNESRKDEDEPFKKRSKHFAEIENTFEKVEHYIDESDPFSALELLKPIYEGFLKKQLRLGSDEKIHFAKTMLLLSRLPESTTRNMENPYTNAKGLKFCIQLVYRANELAPDHPHIKFWVYYLLGKHGHFSEKENYSPLDWYKFATSTADKLQNKKYLAMANLNLSQYCLFMTSRVNDSNKKKEFFEKSEEHLREVTKYIFEEGADKYVVVDIFFNFSRRVKATRVVLGVGKYEYLKYHFKKAKEYFEKNVDAFSEHMKFKILLFLCDAAPDKKTAIAYFVDAMDHKANIKYVPKAISEFIEFKRKSLGGNIKVDNEEISNVNLKINCIDLNINIETEVSYHHYDIIDLNKDPEEYIDLNQVSEDEEGEEKIDLNKDV